MPAAAASAQLLVAVVRSVLRYLHLVGLIATPLDWAVPAVAAVRGRSLPRGVSETTVTAPLSSCDRRRTVGRRDYAILLLLARLGLRASEVAQITLEDVGWRAGEVVVHGKGGRADLLPLAVDGADGGGHDRGDKRRGERGKQARGQQRAAARLGGAGPHGLGAAGSHPDRIEELPGGLPRCWARGLRRWGVSRHRLPARRATSAPGQRRR